MSMYARSSKGLKLNLMAKSIKLVVVFSVLKIDCYVSDSITFDDISNKSDSITYQ